MRYPTLSEVLTANRLQLARWYRFLPFPETREQACVMKTICVLFEAAGGFTPEISKAIGWVG